MNATPRSLSPSPKVQPWHLDREAIVYVRQSTPQQVLDHKESTARQYALADRAVALGWTGDHVTTIDADLGKSGQSIEGRPGFQRLLAEVALNRVGLILGLEMSRLARSCKDWHQLLELCARFRVLLADADGVYDPTDHSDRLLLGLRGMMSEAELHVLKSRMYQGKLNKAKRGELIVAVPVGYLKHPSGQVTLDPDEQVRGIVRLVFDEFDRCGTVHGCRSGRPRGRTRDSWSGVRRGGRRSARCCVTRSTRGHIATATGRPTRVGSNPVARSRAGAAVGRPRSVWCS
jgi:DNA invertase Pin-like site-specific DNA recombinase